MSADPRSSMYPAEAFDRGLAPGHPRAVIQPGTGFSRHGRLSIERGIGIWLPFVYYPHGCLNFIFEEDAL